MSEGTTKFRNVKFIACVLYDYAELKDKLMDEFKGVESRRIRMLIEINVDNEESLQQMAQASFMVLNAVGPYRFYGEPVVKACVENGT